jgi:hypothetical protein
MEGLSCPVCGQEDTINVLAKVWVELNDDGTDAYADTLDMKGGPEWDENSEADCPDCGFSGLMGDFEEDGRKVVYEGSTFHVVHRDGRRSRTYPAQEPT